MDSGPMYQQKYVMLNNNSTNLRPPPSQRRNIPRYHSHHHHHSSGKSCARCCCCCCCFWILLCLILSGLGYALFTILQPQMPQYNVDHFGVNAFNMEKDFSLYTEFVVNVKANNPNEHISFTYGEGSSVVVSYSDSPLCSGKLPAYHQPEKNTTMITVVLKGKTEFGSGLQEALMDNKDTGRIPLTILVKVPVSVVLQSFPLKEVVVSVNCSMVVDNLSPHKQVRILSTKYQYGVGF